jgi:hypothetical protein
MHVIMSAVGHSRIAEKQACIVIELSYLPT